MGSLIETIQKKRFLIPSMPYKDELPISSSSSQSSKAEQLGGLIGIGIRKRISSFSVNIQPCLASTASSAWAFRKSRSMPSLGELAGGPVIRRWWERSWGWLLSKRPTFAKDVEMNEEEIALLGRHSKGTLRHVLYKLRAEIGRLLLLARTDQSALLPTSTHEQFRYDSFSYANNFDRAGKAPPVGNM
ncbi:uncharacterized protein M6B38_112950 [Iris pallida]|uniref:Uncharacterized protein n=1 Tax=Iris pallida TaxID=29817 RepID=A0AAX6ILH1_IRIPA|nr:uncharacterized protein M6B38_112950 [Iris pallida]